MLAHIGDDDGVALCDLPHLFNDKLRLDSAFLHDVGERVFFLPSLDSFQPVAGLALLDDLVELSEYILHVADDRDIHLDVLMDGARVYVDMNDPGLRREGGDLPRDAVIETGADSDNQVRIHDGVVGVECPVHAEHPERQLVSFGECPQPRECRGHRYPRFCGERLQFPGRSGDDYTAARVNDRLPGPRDFLGCVPDLLGMARVCRFISPHLQLRRVLFGGFGLLHVLREIYQHRARAAGRGDDKGLLQDHRQLINVVHKKIVLRDRPCDAHDIRLLEGVVADHSRRHLARECHNRDRIHVGGGDSRYEVCRTGAGGCDTDADPSGGAGVAVGSMCRRLFVTGKDKING